MNRAFSTFRQRMVQKSGGSGAGCDVGCDIPDHSRHVRIAAHQIFDLPDGTECGSVVSAEFFSDVVQGKVGKLPHEIHGDLPRHGGVFGAVVSF